MLTGSEEHGPQGQMQLVDETGAEELMNDRHAAADAHVAIAGRRAGPIERGASSVTKWNSVPPAIFSDGRAWCVSTKTGV
jgi:hypothetical protein